MYLIFSLAILLLIVVYSAVRLKVKKSTALIATISIAILIPAFSTTDFFRFIEKFSSWKNFIFISVGLIVIEICLKVASEDISSRKYIDHDYVEGQGSDFRAEYEAYYASLKVGVDFDLYCSEIKIEPREININNESRFTVGQPSEPCGRIFILGGSTVFNAQVPNSQTIASLLQSK